MREMRDDAVSTGFETPEERRVTAARVYESQPFTRWFMQHVREVCPTAPVGRGEGPVWELPAAPRPLDDVEVRGGDGRRWTFAEMLPATHTDGVLLLHKGDLVYERYFGMAPDTAHLYQSVSKSLGACVASRLIDQGAFAEDTPIVDVLPELAGSGYDGAIVRHLLDMQVAVHFDEEYANDGAEIARLDRLYGFRPSRSSDEPGSSYEFATQTVSEGKHGRVFHYVSLDLQVLAWIMERVTGLRLPELISREVWSRIGTEHEAYIALDGAGSAQLEGGFCSSLRDLARLGLLLCRGGRTFQEQVLPDWFVPDAEQNADRRAFKRAKLTDEQFIPEPAYRDNLWTASIDGHHVIMGLGIFGQLLYVDRAAEFVMAKFATWPAFTDDLLNAHDFWAARSLSEALA